jgi:hypothetical protein
VWRRSWTPNLRIFARLDSLSSARHRPQTCPFPPLSMGENNPTGHHIYPFLDPEFDGKHDFGGPKACRDRYNVENCDLPQHPFIDFASYSISVGKLT